ncbi:MAG TPA: helix-turn-helix domain-containing protein [Desulfobacteraceae bacterium]|nr:helix-turn-helix domain-containing protein [Deltaproteobacteria bacterium]MBW2105011.1 helix-turn-helix domain-containing protein [Deltaproteobacteria bacterium]HDH87050.1 helix-turn-helix domain-containing protein [Desulfobacteraceae bacterium]
MEKPSHKKKEKEMPEDISLGIFLKKAREERHIELDEVVEATRIRRHNLEAIENEEWSKLPSQVFIKGFLKSYAEFLGLDKETVIHHYLRSQSFEKTTTETIKKTRQPSGRPYFIIVIPFLVLAFIVALIYLNKRNISITDKAFQYFGTQSPGEKMGGIAEKEDGKEQEKREKKMLLLENEAMVEEVNKTTLKSKPVDDTGVIEESTIPMKREEKKLLSPRFILTANVKSRTWIAISIDDMPVKEYLFQPGQSPRWTAEKGFNILVGNAAGIEFFFNGKEVGNLGAQGQVIRITLPEG